VLSLTAQSCVIFLTDDTAKTGLNKPLMLQNIMGTTLLSWLSMSLRGEGVSRFFLLCPEQYREEALRQFPSGVEIAVAEGDSASDQLHVFLSTAPVEEKDVTVITQPVLLLPKSATPDFRNAPVPTRAFAVNRRALMDALDDRFSFQDFFAENGRPMTDRDGWYALSDPAELADWQAILGRETLCRLVREGVEVWDYRNTYVDADVFVGKGTILLPGTVLKNGTVVESAPCAYSLREMVELVNADPTAYSAAKLEALAEMIRRYPVMKDWDISNLPQ
jgi:bifunctional UDP-N-acetylglucosamine pyrophosphorylase/glucosamine-1-phosphate N-acetyltransferase